MALATAELAFGGGRTLWMSRRDPVAGSGSKRVPLRGSGSPVALGGSALPIPGPEASGLGARTELDEEEDEEDGGHDEPPCHGGSVGADLRLGSGVTDPGALFGRGL